jgi:hypothetical protein
VLIARVPAGTGAESCPTSEFGGYRQFSESPLGQRYQAATLGAIDKSRAEAAESLGHRLAAAQST